MYIILTMRGPGFLSVYNFVLRGLGVLSVYNFVLRDLGVFSVYNFVPSRRVVFIRPSRLARQGVATVFIGGKYLNIFGPGSSITASLGFLFLYYTFINSP